MASQLYLMHRFSLSAEQLVVRWSKNVLWQFFSGMVYFKHRLPCDATQIGRFRPDLSEDRLELLLKATIDTVVAIEAVKPKDLERVIVDTTVQEKAIAQPVDSRLLEIARHKVVSAAKRAGNQFKPTFAKEGKALQLKAGDYCRLQPALAAAGDCRSGYSSSFFAPVAVCIVGVTGHKYAIRQSWRHVNSTHERLVGLHDGCQKTDFWSRRL